MIHYCTYLDKNFLSRAIALHGSLMRHSPSFTLWILCFDDETVEAFTSMQLEGVRLIPLADLEEADPDLRAVKGSRSTVEYYFTASPSLPRFVFDQHPEIELLTYLDADLLFYSSPEVIYEEMGSGSVLIVPHRFPESLRHLEEHGVYNVGLISFRNDDTARRVLDRWRDQCLEWCFDRVEDGRFADQRYLDDWPDQPGVVVLENSCAGVAPWNVSRYELDFRTVPPLVDGIPLVFYHFHGVKTLRSGIWDTLLDAYDVRDRKLRRGLYRPYILALHTAAREIPSSLEQPHLASTIRSGRAPWWRIVVRVLKGGVMFTPTSVRRRSISSQNRKESR